MTAEELIELVKNGPADTLVARLAPLTEIERRKLSKTAVNLRKELTPKDVGAFFHQRSLSLLRTKLALFGVGPLGEVQRLRLWHIVSLRPDQHDCREELFQILRDRKPDWLSKWVDHELQQRDTIPDWRFIRRLIREGICPKPQSEAYILNLLLEGFRYCDQQKILKENLLDDPDLLNDEVWRIFELAPARGTILGGTDITDVTAIEAKSRHAAFSWGHAFRDLSREGKLDRQRLLSASLSGLLRNTEARNTVWFCKFHELLEPTQEEQLCLQKTYLQLLSHPVPGVVGMALDFLGDLAKNKQLDVALLLEAVAPVFHLQPKAQPIAAVKLLGRVSAASKEHAPRLAEVLMSGLAHPTPQVQEAIVQLLDKVRDEAADVIATALPSQLVFLAPSLQDRARRLVVDETPAPDAPAHQAQTCPTSDLIEEARQIPSPWREMAGIDSLLQAIEGTGGISAVSFDPMAVPRLYPNQRVQPIGTLDELIERLTVAVEGLNDPIEFELLVDGLSRLCDQRPDDFQARVAPMLLRIEKLLATFPTSLATSTGGLRAALFRLLLRWCDRDVSESRDEGDGILEFLNVRLGQVELSIRKRQAAPLLACPTHRQGWIDPRDMAARLETYQQNGLEPSQHDFIQGILRLAPDGRAEALARAGNLQRKYAAAFRYALGGPLEETSLPSAVLLAACRARTPFAELTELQSLADVEGPDALHPARYSWQVVHSDSDSPAQWARLNMTAEPAIRMPEKVRNLPATLMHVSKRGPDFAWDGQTGVNRWKATVWPAKLDPYFAMGAKVHAGPYNQASLLRQRATFLGPLFDPEVPFTEMGQLHLALCLNEQAPEVTGLAVDALVELIRDGRCIGTELGGVLGRMIPYNFIKLNRLGKHLETTGRASLLHAHVCGQVVQTACAGLTEARKDLHHLLGPLLEWLSALEQGVHEELRLLLEKLTSGKTGELARKLLALRSTPNKRRALLVEALQGRLQRARKWAN